MKRKDFLIHALAIEVFLSLLIFVLTSIWIQERAIVMVIGAGTLLMFLVLLFLLWSRARLRQKETQSLKQEITALAEWPYPETKDSYRTPELSLLADSIHHCLCQEGDCSHLVDKDNFRKRIHKTAINFKNEPFLLLYFKFASAQKEQAIQYVMELFPRHYVYAKEDGLFLLEDTLTHEKEIGYRAQKIVARIQGDNEAGFAQAFAMVYPYHSFDEMLSWIEGNSINDSLYPLENLSRLMRSDMEVDEALDSSLSQYVFGTATYLPDQNSYFIRESSHVSAPSFLLISQDGFIDSIDVSLMVESKLHSVTYYSHKESEGTLRSLLGAIKAKGIYFRYVRVDERMVGFVYALEDEEGYISKERYRKLAWELAKLERELLISYSKQISTQRDLDASHLESKVHGLPKKIKNKDVCKVIENRINSGKEGALLFIRLNNENVEASSFWRSVFKRLHYEKQLTDFTPLNESEALIFLDESSGDKAKSRAIDIVKILHRPFLLEEKIQEAEFAFYCLSYPTDFLHPNEALALWHQYLKSLKDHHSFSLMTVNERTLFSFAKGTCDEKNDAVQGYFDSMGHLRYLHFLLSNEESPNIIDLFSYMVRHKRQVNKRHIQKIFIETKASIVPVKTLEAINSFVDHLPRFQGNIHVLTHHRLAYQTRRELENMKINYQEYEQCSFFRFYTSETILNFAEKGIILPEYPGAIKLGKPQSHEEEKLAFAIGVDAISREISVEELSKILRKNRIN